MVSRRPAWESVVDLHERAVSEAREALGPEAFATHFADGPNAARTRP
jgi:hypothetical protein